MLLPFALALSFSLSDRTGQVHTGEQLDKYEATVFVFLAPQCPLSRAVVRELAEVRAAFPDARVKMLAVNAGLPLPIPDLVDPGNELAGKLRARVTPEAVVVSRMGKVVYAGRIDDRAVRLGRTRRAAARHELRDALQQVLAGKTPKPARTQATGCSIEFGKPRGPSGPAFARDVAPILYRHCVSCHREGESGPFPLIAYRDAAVRASTLARVARERIMPPWLPAPNAAHPFAGERWLTEAEIVTLEKWAASGAAEGDAALTPAAPPAPAKWPLGTPDAVIRLGRGFPVPASGGELYHCLVIPSPLKETRYVRAFDFRANSRALHHALLFLDSSQAARRHDAETDGPGYPCFGTPGFLVSASLGGWTPGNEALAYPDGAGVRFRANADLVMQLHLHPDGVEAEEVAPEIALYFQDEAPRKKMMDVALGTRRIDIPAGEKRYVVRDHFTIPVALEVTGIIPHAHYLARTMRGWAVLPDGKRVELLDIPEWNFNWQQQYRYRESFVLPAETRIEMEFVYDNSEGNAHNPFRPARRVVWGPEAADEMAGLHVQVMPLDEEGARELAESLWGRLMRERWGSLE